MENINMLKNEINVKTCCPMMRCSMYMPYSLEQYIFDECQIRLKRVPAEEIED